MNADEIPGFVFEEANVAWMKCQRKMSERIGRELTEGERTFAYPFFLLCFAAGGRVGQKFADDLRQGK